MFRPRAGLVWLLIFGSSLGWFSLQRQHDYFEIDEAGWMQASIHVAHAVRDARFSPGDWEFREDGAYGNLNPTLGKVFFACRMLFESWWEERALPTPDVASREHPSHARMLYTLRLVSCVFGAAVVVIAGMIAGVVGGWAASLVTVGMLLLNPVFLQISTTVVTDMPLTFFLLSSLLACLVGVGRRGKAAVFGTAATLGVLAGLATSVKYSGVVVLLPFFLVLGAGLFWRGMLTARLGLAASALGVLLFLIVVYASNPFFWPEVKPGLVELAGAELGRLDSPLSLAAAHTPSDSDGKALAPVLYAATRPIQYPMVYLRWKLFMAEYAKSGWMAPDTRRFVRNLLVHRLSLPKVEPIFLLAGVVWLLVRARTDPAAQLFLMYAAACGVAIYLTRLGELDRYLFLLYVLRTLAASMGLALCMRLLLRRMNGGHGLWNGVC